MQVERTRKIACAMVGAPFQGLERLPDPLRDDPRALDGNAPFTRRRRQQVMQDVLFLMSVVRQLGNAAASACHLPDGCEVLGRPRDRQALEVSVSFKE